MKKYLIIAILMLGMASLAFAEMGASTYGSISNFGTMQQKIGAYNPSATAISSNSVVVLSTDAAMAANKATGAVVMTTTTQDSNTVVGITEAGIPAYGSGIVIVRGPAKCLVTAAVSGALVAGASLSTTTTAGYLSPTSGSLNARSVVGFLINVATDPAKDSAGVPIEGPVYWVYVTR